MFVAIAIFILLLNVPQAFAQQQECKATFTGVASGKALLFPNWAPSDEGGDPQEVVVAKGIMFVTGSAVVNGPFPQSDGNLPPGDIYMAESGVQALGSVCASGRGYMINALLYSNGVAGGIFMDETEAGDIFIIGAPASTNVMMFRAIYKDPTGTHMISGKAGVFAIPKLGDAGTMGLFVTFLKEDGVTPLLTIIWAQENVVLGPTTLLAAHPFVHNVRITQLS
jgi:hypothetical protein